MRKTSFVIMMACALLPSCSKNSSESSGSYAVPEPAAQGALAKGAEAPAQSPQTVFNTKCTVCHGSVGAGDGPGAAALDPKPRAFADPAWQNSVTDEQIKKAILEGGAAIGKSPGMPANPDLSAKPDVVNGLVAIVRGFKKG
ncbi:MAG TPA: c-type cytochrome [Polyangiaceae bacterium]|nr:c-type cytochrome [Polyangiaceae bacterium]